jgi:uncharacterized protein YbjT (DUF2867 family)
VILVTGGTGFIGTKVVHELRAQGRDVRCVVRDPHRAATLEAWGCEIVRGDVTDAAGLKRAATGCEAIVHLVAIITGSRQQFERVMKQGTRNLVEAAREAGVRRFVLMSALGVSEETRTLTPYYESKWDMENAVRGSGLEHVIFRPSFVFGRDGGVLPTFVRQVRWSPVVTVIGPGDTRLQPIWVEDVAAFFAKSIDLGQAANRVFELGGPDAVTWDELYERIKRVLGARRPTVHVPFAVARLGAAATEWLPGAPLTKDQLKMLQAGDNVADVTPAIETFGIGLLPLDEQIRRVA